MEIIIKIFFFLMFKQLFVWFHNYAFLLTAIIEFIHLYICIVLENPPDVPIKKMSPSNDRVQYTL